MKVNQGIVSQELREEYIKRLATLMEVPSSRVQEKLFCISEAPVGSEQDTTYITYYVLRVLGWLHIVHDIKEPSPAVIAGQYGSQNNAPAAGA